MTEISTIGDVLPFFGNMGLAAIFFWLYYKSTEKMDRERAEHKDEMKTLLLQTRKDAKVRENRMQKTTDEFKKVVQDTTKVNTEMTASMQANKEAIQSLSQTIVEALKK